MTESWRNNRQLLEALSRAWDNMVTSFLQAVDRLASDFEVGMKK